MILCQTCFTEAPDGSTQCPACGEPLMAHLAPMALPRPVRTTQRPTPDVVEMLRAGEPAAAGAQTAPSATPRPSWPPFGPTTGGTTPAAPVASLSFQFPSGEIYTLSGKRTFVVGREDAATGSHPDLDLTPEGGIEAGVSRSHAAIHVRPEGYFIEDLDSANDTLLNAQRLAPRQTYPLHNGDQVRFALLNALVVIAGRAD